VKDPNDDGPVSSPADALASDLPIPSHSVAHDELLDAVRTAVGELPHDLKVTMLLHHYENLSYREIADITHCSERGVETRLYRARQRLRETLGEFIREASSC
jgi:RNA polymerase sigma-70 factor (ECF subfamily)